MLPLFVLARCVLVLTVHLFLTPHRTAHAAAGWRDSMKSYYSDSRAPSACTEDDLGTTVWPHVEFVWRSLFELCSAFGNVGLTLGSASPGIGISFSYDMVATGQVCILITAMYVPSTYVPSPPPRPTLAQAQLTHYRISGTVARARCRSMRSMRLLRRREAMMRRVKMMRRRRRGPSRGPRNSESNLTSLRGSMASTRQRTRRPGSKRTAHEAPRHSWQRRRDWRR